MSSQYIQLLMMGATSDGSVTPETSDDGSVTPQTSDDGSDTRECRICFVGAENEGLIHPCLCSGGYKYVHRSCLEIWRESNRGTVKYNACEVCKEPYTTVYVYENETAFVRAGGKTCCGMYLVYIGCYSFPASFFVSFLDEATGYGSLSVLGGGHPPPPLVMWIQRDPVFHGSYYLSLTSYASAMILFASLAMYIFPRLNRRKIYHRGMLSTWLMCIIAASSHLFCYILFILTGDAQTYFSFIGVSTIPTVLAIRSLLLSHNSFLRDMNTVYNREIVHNMEEGPSFEIEIEG